MESSEDTSIESTDKNTIPVQACQVRKIEKVISAIIEETKETVTQPSRKHEENISVSEGVKNEENISVSEGVKPEETIAISPRRSVHSW